jgi:hypothetical protein
MTTETTHSFASYDGTKLEGTLALPAGNSTKLALLVHGIMSSRDELGLFSGMAEHLAMQAVNPQSMPKMTLAGIVNDIHAAYLCASKLTRPSAIHPIGMSFGGGVTAFWAATAGVNVDSVVLLAPVIDYQEDILGQHGLLEKGRISESASASLAKNAYVETDEIAYGPALINELPHINGIRGLGDLKCPAVILHGDADSIVPYSLSMKFAEQHTQCRLVNIAGTDHGFGVPGDEDLTSLETKERHAEVFEIISQFLLSEGQDDGNNS